jgi:hypothetical protein
MNEINSEFNNIPPKVSVSLNQKKLTKVVVFILVLIIIVAAGVYYFLKISKQNIKTNVTVSKVFSVLPLTQTPSGFSTDFPKNGLVKVFGSEEYNVGNDVEGVLRFSSSKTLQENYTFYKNYFNKIGWTVSQKDLLFPGGGERMAFTKGALGAFVELANFSDTTKSTSSIVEITIFSNK